MFKIPGSSSPVPVPREIWVIVASAFVVAIGYGLIAPLLPQFVVSFDVSMTAAGMVVAIFSLTRLLFAPAAGGLVDRLGTRKVYLVGLLLVAVTTGMVAGAHSYWHILVLRGLSGIGSTMFTVSAMGIMVRLSPPAIRGRCSALYGSAFLLGNVVGPLLGAALSFLGLRLPFIIYAVGLVVAALVVMLLMPVEEKVAVATKSRAGKGWYAAWGNTAFRAVLMSNFAHGWINMGVRAAVLPLLAAAIFADGAAAAGIALACFAAGNALVLQFSGALADSLGRRPLILGGLVGSGIFSGVLGCADEVWTLVIISLLAGAAAGVLNPAQQAVMADVVGNDKGGGQLLSVFQMSGDLGQIIGPVVIGFLADRQGFPLAFASNVLIALMGVVAWGIAKETLLTGKSDPAARG